MSDHTAFAAAERLAPVPYKRDDATREAWLRHYVAEAIAAHCAFRDALPTSTPAADSRPDLGLLIGLAVAATAAAVALDTPRGVVAERLWSLTPEAGALNGEWEDWLDEKADELGINPADIDHHLEAADFASLSRPVAAEEVPTP